LDKRRDWIGTHLDRKRLGGRAFQAERIDTHDLHIVAAVIEGLNSEQFMGLDHLLMNDVLEIAILPQDDMVSHSPFHAIKSEFEGHLLVERFRIDMGRRA
jgi:hypothetical protein